MCCPFSTAGVWIQHPLQQPGWDQQKGHRSVGNERAGVLQDTCDLCDLFPVFVPKETGPHSISVVTAKAKCVCKVGTRDS